MIVDKTVINSNSIKHRSVNWILDYEKFTRKNGEFYDISKDYFGFFPDEDEKYQIHDFEKMDDIDLDSLSAVYDMAYFTDTYGVMGNEWYRHRDINETSKSIYGGLSEKDIVLLRKLKKRNKPIITEYNTMGFPTPFDVRKSFQDMFGLEWTGWMGRYIASLDTINNPDLPKWIVLAFRNQNKQSWTYKEEGMIFFHIDGRVAVLEKGRHLNNPMPQIYTDKKNQTEYNVPGTMIYPFWIDIVTNKNDSNEVISKYLLSPTWEGAKLLAKYNIPKIFPAIIHRSKPYTFYYFCGDFADNPTKFRFAKLEGITGLKFLMYNAVDITDRNRFFWEFYMPMMQSIMDDCYQNRLARK